MRKILGSVACALLICAWCAGAEKAVAGGEMNSILASVDGEAVTLMDVLPLTHGKELQARAVYSGERLEQVIMDYRKQVVNELIDNLLVQAEFRRSQFTLPSQEIEREIDQFAVRIGCRSREQLERRLRKDGRNIDEVRMAVRRNMMIQMMLYRQIHIAVSLSPKEIYEYFQKNEAKFATPEKVGLAMLKLDSSRADVEAAKKEIAGELEKDPGKFDELVARYAPELGDGNLGEIDSKLLRPEFAGAFKEYVPGTVAGPIKVYDGLVWLKVVSYSPPVKAEFKTVEERIKLELEHQYREKAVADYIGRLRSRAVIEYYF